MVRVVLCFYIIKTDLSKIMQQANNANNANNANKVIKKYKLSFAYPKYVYIEAR
jgi:hypothetical protein